MTNHQLKNEIKKRIRKSPKHFGMEDVCRCFIGKTNDILTHRVQMSKALGLKGLSIVHVSLWPEPFKKRHKLTNSVAFDRLPADKRAELGCKLLDSVMRNVPVKELKKSWLEK